MYDNKHMPHYPLPEFDTVSYFKSNSTERVKRGAKGFNEVRFEDLKGKEQVFIHSQRRMDIRALASYYETNFGNREIVVGWEKDGQTGGDLNILVKGEENVHVKKTHWEQIEKKLFHGIKEDTLYEHQQNAAWMVTNKAEINAKEITIEGSQKIVLKVGPSFITLEPSGITIYGPQVKINSGGFASGVPPKTMEDPIDAYPSDDGSPGTLRRLRTATGGGGGRSHNRRRISGQHYRYPPRPGEDARMTAVRDMLNDTESGRHTLEIYERYGVGTTFNPGRPTEYDSCHQLAEHRPQREYGNSSAVHGARRRVHAQAENEHTGPDITTSTREESTVDRMLQEEAHGSAQESEAKRELEEAGHDMSGAHASVQEAYNEGFERAPPPNARAIRMRHRKRSMRQLAARARRPCSRSSVTAT